MKVNSDKMHNLTFNVGESVLGIQTVVKLLGLYIDIQLVFNVHIDDICHKPGIKRFSEAF